jgi:hypothetical protein
MASLLLSSIGNALAAIIELSQRPMGVNSVMSLSLFGPTPSKLHSSAAPASLQDNMLSKLSQGTPKQRKTDQSLIKLRTLEGSSILMLESGLRTVCTTISCAL